MTAGADVTTERFGRPFRQYSAAVSAEAVALAWVRQEDAPQGAVVVVEREISARGRLGRVWTAPQETTLACAYVLRPEVPAEEADVAWLVGGVAAAAGAEAVSGRPMTTWWPDLVIDRESREEVALVKAETQLGPGTVRSAVVTVRIDLASLGIDPEHRDDALEAVVGAFDDVADLSEGSVSAAGAYEPRCDLVGQRVKLILLPKGETRGVARRIDPAGRLELESGTGMTERISVDMVRHLVVMAPGLAPVPREPGPAPSPGRPIPFGPPTLRPQES